MGVLDVWYEHAYPDNRNRMLKRGAKAEAVIAKTVAKARTQTNATLLKKIAERGASGGWRLREDPPILTRVDDQTREKVIQGLEEYWHGLQPERAFMLNRYHVVDDGHRIVGVGSVGTRAYLALLLDNDDNDPLFSAGQGVHFAGACSVRRAAPQALWRTSRHACGLWTARPAGFQRYYAGRYPRRRASFFVRQMKNMKASIPVEYLTGEAFYFYAEACGALLSRAHARVGDAAAINCYCGGSAVLDEALASWAEAYGDQTERDHAQWVKAIKSGKVKAIQGV